ncbi:MAG: DUF2259 domain-containing protein [Spirochaetota bacterium]
MKRRSISALLVTILVVTAEVATADAAIFTNLGFSESGRVFMFSQHGIERASGQAYAEIFTVDVPANDFIRSGVFRQRFPDPISTGQTGHAALLTLLREADTVIDEQGINHFRQGRIVYLLLNSDEPRSELTFRDFVSGESYHVQLEQEQRGSGTDTEARFHIELTRTPSEGTETTYTVGRPDLFREGVSSYRIRQAIIAPDGESMVFVVEMERPGSSSTAIRYMVETVTF